MGEAETVSSLPTASQSAPRVINVDKNAASPKAIMELKAARSFPEEVELRQVKYLNNLIEQDHRFIKRLTKPGIGFFSFETANRTLQGNEAMNMIRKGQVQGVGKGDIWSSCRRFLLRSSLRFFLPPSFLQHSRIRRLTMDHFFWTWFQECFQQECSDFTHSPLQSADLQRLIASGGEPL